MKGLDHLVLAVNNLDEAVARYKSIGFTVTPRAKHPFGTHNCLIQLNGFFLEILTIGEPDNLPAIDPAVFSFPNFNKQFLRDKQGPSMLVLDSDDFRGDKTQAELDDLQTWPVFEFSRQTALPTGESATVSFGLNFVTDPQIPNAAFFTCQQFAPHYFWKPEYQTHKNSAQQIHEVTIVTKSPHDHLSFLGKFAQTDNYTIKDESLSVHTARGDITCRTPLKFEQTYGLPAPTLSDGPQICGLTIAVKNINKAPHQTCTIDGAAIKFIQEKTTV